MLLDHKADPNITDNDGMTALRYAIQGRSSEVVELLLKSGAHVNDADLEVAGDRTSRIYHLLEEARARQAKSSSQSEPK